MLGRLALSVFIGLVGALLVHIAVIAAMPRLAEHNAWGRFANLGPMDRVVRVDPLRSSGPSALSAEPGSALQNFTFVDPAFVTASCRFSLAGGPVRMTAAPVQTTFWSASIYARNGDNLYSINDRSAVDGIFDLLVGTADQIVDVKAAVSAERQNTTIPIEVDLAEGYMTIRVLVDQESQRPSVEGFVGSLRCQPVQTIAGDKPSVSKGEG